MYFTDVSFIGYMICKFLLVGLFLFQHYLLGIEDFDFNGVQGLHHGPYCIALHKNSLPSSRFQAFFPPDFNVRVCWLHMSAVSSSFIVSESLPKIGT